MTDPAKFRSQLGEIRSKPPQERTGLTLFLIAELLLNVYEELYKTEENQDGR